jgi:hypothetical protein
MTDVVHNRSRSGFLGLVNDIHGRRYEIEPHHQPYPQIHASVSAFLSTIKLHLKRPIAETIGSLVGRLISKFPLYLKRAEKHLGPIIRHRLQMEAEYGVDWLDKPVSWCLFAMVAVI